MLPYDDSTPPIPAARPPSGTISIWSGLLGIMWKNAGKFTFPKKGTPELKSHARLGAKPSKHLVVVPSTLGTKLLIPPLARISTERVRFSPKPRIGRYFLHLHGIN